MGDLRRIRDVNWDEIEAEETRRLRQMTVEEGIREYLALRREFEPMLRATEALFRAEREADLIRLQERLRKLDEWKGDRVDELVEALLQLQSRDERYILDWLGQFEKALDDATLVREYRRIRERYHRR